MVAIHTSREDLYSRLLCVHEVERAIHVADVEVDAAMSEKYKKDMVSRFQYFEGRGFSEAECLEAANIEVRTIKARPFCLLDGLCCFARLVV